MSETVHPIFHHSTYSELPQRFWQSVKPTPVSSPELLKLNTSLAGELGLNLEVTDKQTLAGWLSGNSLPEHANPLAMAYAGHQFGHFVPQLGDGRAILVGERVATDGKPYDIQLKGAGRTVFSRGGDGRAALGPVIREYIVSEAMHTLGIPTTRALAMVRTGDPVYRETPLPGAILTRVAKGHIRVGTFEYFAARQDVEAIRILADYSVNRFYPELLSLKANDRYRAFYRSVAERQAYLISEWMRVGFIHGVMNTDNTSITGETIDYGPCAFMDEYSHSKVFSSIDQHGRYAYGNQPPIARWNLESLGACLVPLLADVQQDAIGVIRGEMDVFMAEFTRQWQQTICAKIGFRQAKTDFVVLGEQLLSMMEDQKADFTNVFRSLSEGGRDVKLVNPSISNEQTSGQTPSDRSLWYSNFLLQFKDPTPAKIWLHRWLKSLSDVNQSLEDAQYLMKSVNPAFIPRNHRVEEAIRAAIYENDLSVADKLIQVLSNPYDNQPLNEEWRQPPTDNQKVIRTFCGT
jgi:serine/tyrosine/threonine adenylyltransferase